MTVALPPGASEADTRERLPAGTRAVMIGTGRYASLPDLPSVACTVTALRDVLVERCGVLPGNIVGPLLDPAEPADMGRALVQCAGAATDVLLVYYCGHGRVGADSQLYLAASRTAGDNASLGFTGFSYQQLRQSLAGCQARTVVVILDCCFAGRAADPAEGALASISAPGAPAGGYLLASAAYSEAALAPLGEPHTAFGGALITLLADGIPDGPQLITLNEVFRELDHRLSAQGRPRPRAHSSGSAGELVLAANGGYQPPQPLAVLIPARAGDEGAPYRGLAPYEDSDSRLFYGRETLIAGLCRALAGQLDVPGPLVVLGSSGAGKSSLLRAGLRPSLDDGLPGFPQVRTWPKIIITPGKDPVSALAAQLGALLAADPRLLRGRLNQPQGLAELAGEAVRRHAAAGQASGRRLVIIADQFEDIFGPGVTREQREAFLTSLDSATSPQSDGEPPAVLAVVGLRADFYGRAQSEPFLARALEQKRTFDITAMTASELRDVITKPAIGAGLTVEPELTDRILADLRSEDLGSGTGYDTRLPLLSHALLATWRYREGGSLTVRGYQAAGGVSGAVARTAEQLWAADRAGQNGGDGGPTALGEDEREIARRLLLQLVAVGPEGTEVARRRVPLPELAEALGAATGNPDRALAVSRVLGKLVSARLVTVDRDHAEIIHDSLLRTWPQLWRWIDEDRSYLFIGRQATEAAVEWDRRGRHLADLYSGSRLVLARQWASATGLIPALTTVFLRSSVRYARARRIGLAAAVIAALLFAGIFVAVTKSDDNNLQARQDALESEQLAATANTLQSTDPELARDLALSAYRLSPTDQAAQALAQASVTPSATEINVGAAAAHIAFSPGGSVLAVSSRTPGRTLSLWIHAETSRPAEAGTVPVGNAVCSLAFIPGRQVLAAGCDSVTTLWDITRPGHPVNVGAFGRRGQSTGAIAVSPDGRWLAIGGTDGLLQLWNISDQSHPKLAGSVTPARQITSVAFSADSRALATAATYRDGSNQVLVTDLRGRTPLSRLTPVPGTYDAAWAVAFSPRGHLLATGGVSGPLLYDATNPDHLRALPDPSFNLPAKSDGSSTPINSVSFAPDSQTIALGLVDAGIAVGPVVGETQNTDSYILPSSVITNATAVSPDGRYVAGAGDDGIVRVWPIAHYPLGSFSAEPFVDQQAISSDGRLLVLPASQGGFEVWDISSPARPVRDSLLGPAWAAASFTQYGRLLMTMNAASTELQLWSLANPRSPTPVGKPFHANGQLIPDASPFSKLLAIADSGSNSITVWDISRPDSPVKRATISIHQDFASSSVPFAPVFLGSTVLSIENAQDTAILRWGLGRAGGASPLPPLSTPNGLLSVADVSTCRTLAIVSSGHQVQLWDEANPRAVPARSIGTASNLYSDTAQLTMDNACQVIEATNEGTTDDIEVWDARNPWSPRLIATLQTTGAVKYIAVSDDDTRIAALMQPKSMANASSQTLDVWSVSPSGTTHHLASIPASNNMNYAEFIPRTHLIAFNPAVTNDILPDILNPDPQGTYRSLCETTQHVLSPSAWSRYVPTGIPYEPPC